MRMALALVVIVALSACAPAVKPDLPGPDKIVSPTVVTVTRNVYVPVPSWLTAAEPVAEGTIPQCFDVAAQRKAALLRANGKLRQIGTIQGTEVQP